MARPKRNKNPEPPPERPVTLPPKDDLKQQFATHEEIVDALEGVLRRYVERQRRKRLATAEESCIPEELPQSKDDN